MTIKNFQNYFWQNSSWMYIKISSMGWRNGSRHYSHYGWRASQIWDELVPHSPPKLPADETTYELTWHCALAHWSQGAKWKKQKKKQKKWGSNERLNKQTNNKNRDNMNTLIKQRRETSYSNGTINSVLLLNTNLKKRQQRQASHYRACSSQQREVQHPVAITITPTFKRSSPLLLPLKGHQCCYCLSRNVQTSEASEQTYSQTGWKQNKKQKTKTKKDQYTHTYTRSFAHTYTDTYIHTHSYHTNIDRKPTTPIESYMKTRKFGKLSSAHEMSRPETHSANTLLHVFGTLVKHQHVNVSNWLYYVKYM